MKILKNKLPRYISNSMAGNTVINLAENVWGIMVTSLLKTTSSAITLLEFSTSFVPESN
jgi:hypothetical protein